MRVRWFERGSLHQVSLVGKRHARAWLGSLVGKGGWDLGVGQWLHVAAESAA
ncbi:MAG: hypothetical protein ACK6CE_14325 [Planctomycetota bacterium]